MDMALPGNLNPDCDDDTWAQHVVATLAAGSSLESVGDSIQGEITMGDSVTRPTSPLPPSTSGAAAKKQSRIAVPTRVSARNKDSAASKQKSGSTNKPKSPSAAKGKGVLSLPADSSTPSTSAPTLDPAAVCSRVVGMIPAPPGEQLSDTMARLDLNQLRIATAILDLKDSMVNRDNDAKQREDALRTQVTDARAYIGDVVAAHAQPPITTERVTQLGAKVDALTNSTEQVTALGAKVDALTKSTDGRFASFQTVMNAITDRVTTMPSSQPAAPSAAIAPVLNLQPHASAGHYTAVAAPSVEPSASALPPVPASSMTAGPPTAPAPLPASMHASQPMTSFHPASYPPPSMPPAPAYPPGVGFSQPHANQHNMHVPASSNFLPPLAGPPSRRLRTVRLTNVTFGMANLKSTMITLLQHIGLQLRDAPVYRRIGYDGLSVTFRQPDHAARLMAAVQTEERFAHMGADLLNSDADGPTIDEICGSVPTAWPAQGGNRYASG